MQCAFSLHKMRVERRVFYPKISQQSCYVQHCTCNQKVAMHSMFNIKEFHCGFSTLLYTISKCILQGNSACMCVKIAENESRKKGVLSEDIAAILLCTALYLHPKSSHALYVQYKRVSLWFFNAILYY